MLNNYGKFAVPSVVWDYVMAAPKENIWILKLPMKSPESSLFKSVKNFQKTS